MSIAVTSRRLAAKLASIAGLAALLASTPACGVLSAVTNPGAAWALNEPAPMSIVVRRAEVANATAHEVERLLGEAAFGPKAKWVDAITIAKADAEAMMKTAGGDPIYAMTQTRVLAAEAWLVALSKACAEKDEHASLMAALSDDADEQYAAIVAQGSELAELRAQIAKEEAALDDDKLGATEKAEHEKARIELEAKIEKAKETFDPKREALVKLVGEQAGKVKAPLSDRMKLAIVDLRHAVSDAKMANSTAILRYPLAMPGMTTDVQTSAKRFAADSVEEQIGNRPNLDTLAPEVALEGTDVKLTLNGIPAEKIGSISPSSLVSETTVRTKDYVERVLTLLAYTADTDDLLTFQADLLDAWIKGLGADPKMAEATNISDIQVTVAPTPPGAPPAKGFEGARPSGPRSIGGLAVATCAKPAKKKAKPAAEKAEAKKEPGKATGKQAGKTEKEKKPAADTKPASKPAAPAKPASKASAPATRPAGGSGKPAGAARPAAASGEDCAESVIRNGVKVCL